jgi:exodeoxyribonuclease VII small subunit
MENTEVSLDESFSLYQSGVEKIKACNVMLDEVEKKMQIINADGTIGEME